MWEKGVRGAYHIRLICPQECSESSQIYFMLNQGPLCYVKVVVTQFGQHNCVYLVRSKGLLLGRNRRSRRRNGKVAVRPTTRKNADCHHVSVWRRLAPRDRIHKHRVAVLGQGSIFLTPLATNSPSRAYSGRMVLAYERRYEHNRKTEMLPEGEMLKHQISRLETDRTCSGLVLRNRLSLFETETHAGYGKKLGTAELVSHDAIKRPFWEKHLTMIASNQPNWYPTGGDTGGAV